jgi:hypothetical protein
VKVKLDFLLAVRASLVERFLPSVYVVRLENMTSSLSTPLLSDIARTAERCCGLEYIAPAILSLI